MAALIGLNLALADRGRKRSSKEAGLELFLDLEAHTKFLHVTSNAQLVADNKKLNEELLKQRAKLRTKDLLIEHLMQQKFSAMRENVFTMEQRGMLEYSMRELLLPLTKAQSMAENDELKSELKGALDSIIQALDEVNEYDEGGVDEGEAA